MTKHNSTDGVPVPPAAFRFVDAPRALQDALLAYCRRPADHEADALIRLVLATYGVFVPHGSNTTQVAPQEPANLSDNAPGVALPHSRPRCGKQSGMCAMTPDGAGNPATGICPECGVDCGSAGVTASDDTTARAAMTSTTEKE